MKRWKFSTLLLLCVLIIGSIAYSSYPSSAGSDPCGDPINCIIPQNACPQGSVYGDPCGNGGKCLWWRQDPCCAPLLVCVEGFKCCLGPGCDPYCNFPGCDPFNTCTTCGDGIVNPPEQCDDGNRVGGDGCNPYCAIEGCGNGIIEEYLGEECDDGNTQSGDGCSSTCLLEGVGWCGDGEVNQAWEECDDGNLVQGDGCFECLIEVGEVPYQCDDTQVILKLSGVTNAHGAVWSETNPAYGVEVCFDEIFGYEYNPTAAPGENQACLGTNKALRLEDVTNAHGELPEFAAQNYEDVCYGNLVCVSRPAEEGCLPSEKEVVSLSDDTNAHLEVFDSNQYTSHGEYSICCTDGIGEPGINFVRWERPLGYEVGESNVNSSVWLVAYTHGIADGTEVTFDVDECDTLGGNPPCLLKDDITVVSADVGSGKAKYLLEINDNLFALGSSGELTPDLEFYFTASSEGVNDRVSDILIVHPEEETNNPPIARIASPNHLQIYYTGTEVEFYGICDDENPESVTYEWSVVWNGITEFINTSQTFNHTFQTNGMRTITLKCTDNMGYEDEDQIAITLVSSPGMIAFIGVPSHKEVVPDESEDPKHQVEFSAIDSYLVYSEVAQGELCDTRVTCLAGNCPHYTNNTPVGCGEPNLPVRNAPNTPAEANWSLLYFDWALSDDYGFSSDPQAYEEFALFTGLGTFNVPSNSLNDQHFDLDLNYDYGGISKSEQTTREFTLGHCIDNGNTYLDSFTNPGQIIQRDTSEANWCKGYDGQAGTGDDCCPYPQQCLSDGEEYKCMIENTGCNVLSCDDYNECYSGNQVICNNDTYKIGYTPPEPVDPLWNNPDYHCDESGVQCGCGWSQTDNKCVFKTDWVNIDPSGPCEIGFCEISSAPGAECVEGFIHLEITTNFVVTGGEACQTYQGQLGELQAECNNRAGEVTLPCGRINFELGFFSLANFAVAVALIALVYIFIVNLKKRRE